MEGNSGLDAVQNDLKTRLKSNFNKILFFQTVFTCFSIAFFVIVYYIWRGKQKEAEKNNQRNFITPRSENLTEKEIIQKYEISVRPKMDGNFTTKDAWTRIYNTGESVQEDVRLTGQFCRKSV